MYSASSFEKFVEESLNSRWYDVSHSVFLSPDKEIGENVVGGGVNPTWRGRSPRMRAKTAHGIHHRSHGGRPMMSNKLWPPVTVLETRRFSERFERVRRDWGC